MPAERQQLLRQYFEPTPAHLAVAELVKGGYVRVILTANFDRLCERAIENEGITPLSRNCWWKLLSGNELEITGEKAAGGRIPRRSFSQGEQDR
jgi:hypothetical protein